jgi:DNA-binding beta-propeller fold protein YncE
MAPISRGRLVPALLVPSLVLLLGAAPARGDSFVNFETGQVRPLALSPDQSRLFAINTPDNRLEIFAVDANGLTHTGSVPVGLEPIAVAARNDSEAWVVNHLSDSVSIVDVASAPPRVTRTINTCDEPRDVVFAGPGNDRAFVTAARRGKGCPVPDDLTVEGTGRAVVQVWDAANVGAGLNGTPLANVVLFGDTPRALARSADGSTVYAAVFHSGNQTTSILETLVCDGGASAPPCSPSGTSAPGGVPAPNEDASGVPGPETGLILKFNRSNSRWEDNVGRDWTSSVRFDLPDLDVFAIDAAAAIPAETQSFAHVGTILFNMATNPVNGKLYVTNTDARNEVRFEGPGLTSTTVQGHLHEARITVIDGANVAARHLNKHIDYDVRPASPAVAAASLATPLGMAVTADGTKLYVAAFGSSKIGVFDTAALEDDSFVPSAANHIALDGGGPTGLLLDEARGRLYALTRFDNSIAIVDLASATEIGTVALFNPEPKAIVDGRPLLYDASFTSSNGETSCSSCHVFADFDSLAWDLGNPDDVVLNNPLPFRIGPVGIPKDFHPLKGPMTTQSLRGMANHGSMHWRGDRTGGNDPDSNAFDEVRAFEKFNPAFVGLIGRAEEIPAADMRAFADFILTVTYPPNPIRSLDNSLTTAEQEGRDLFFGRITDVVFNCNGCHTLNPSVNAQPDGSFSVETGFFGSDGFGTFEGESQMFKVAHLRNVYQKVGMFGIAPSPHLGPQVRGFGVLHDGSVDTVFNFLSAGVFSLTNTEQNRLQRFVFSFDSNLKPIVGQQVTLSSAVNTTGVNNRVSLLIARAAAGDCDLVVKTVLAGEQRGGVRLPDGTFQLDREDDATLTDAELRASAILPGQEVTYTCVPRGSGQRIGVDRDEDGFFDRDELDAGTSPTDPGDFPIVPIGIRASTFNVRDDATPPVNPNGSRLAFRSAKLGASPSGVVVPASGSAGDPTSAGANGGGATLTIYRTDGGTDQVVLPLAAGRWKKTGTAANPGYAYSDAKRADGPITAVTIRNGTLAIRGYGAGMYQLDGAPQGGLALRLRLGGEVEFCAAAAAKLPASAFDTTARFVGERNSAAPADCPDVPDVP